MSEAPDSGLARRDVSSQVLGQQEELDTPVPTLFLQPMHGRHRAKVRARAFRCGAQRSRVPPKRAT